MSATSKKQYYRVIGENFLWEKGAILEFNKELDGYAPTEECHIFKKFDTNDKLSGEVLRANPTVFERVYPVNKLTGIVYEGLDRAKEILSRGFRAE